MVFGAFYFSAAAVGWRIEVEAERFLLGWINAAVCGAVIVRASYLESFATVWWRSLRAAGEESES
ncbi:hypothetical protein PSEUDO9AZ_11036 [Pseudomonas sp. 9AZ]|nr:hypothetical protein PSEUDO9AZ_11036 [Pseudomonas sp. 9AZ]